MTQPIDFTSKDEAEMLATFANLARSVVQLLASDPKETDIVEPDESGCDQCTDEALCEKRKQARLHFFAVHMKNGILSLFGTMAESLRWAKVREPRPIITSAGEIPPDIMAALEFRFRFRFSMNFPQFTAPLSKELKDLVKTEPFVTKRWQLVNGEGMGVSLGENAPLREQVPRTRATIVRLF